MVNVYTIQAGTVFAWFMLLLVLRRIILLIIIAIAGHHRPILPDRVPEDKFLKRRESMVPTTEPLLLVFTKDVRANKTISNDSENDTYFLILLLATAVFSDSRNGDCVRTIVYGSIYLFSRIFYAVAYIFGLQPWRTLLFFVGLACTLACSLDLVITMSRRPN